MNVIITTIIESLRGVPPELATLIMSALPVTELRGALPIALVVFKLPLASAFFWAVLGNLIPAWLLLVFFERITVWLRPRSRLYDNFCTWLFARTRRKLDGQVKKYGPWALALFVGIPLPVTGVWTGALAAFVFGLEKKLAFAALAAGAVLAAIIVSSLTLGVIHLPNLLSRLP